VTSSGSKKAVPSTPLLLVPIGGLAVAAVLPAPPLVKGLIVGIPTAIVALPLYRHFQDQWKAKASALGLTYDGADPFDSRKQIPMPLFRRAGGGSIGNAMHGQWRGTEVRLLSMQWHTAKTNQREHWWIGLTPIAAKTAPMHIGKAPPDEGAIDELGLQVVEFELGAFNEAYLVYAADRYVATAVVDQPMMDWLLSSDPQWDYQIADGWLMVMREDLRAKPDPYDLEPVLEALLEFRDRIPRAALSIFGPEQT